MWVCILVRWTVCCTVVGCLWMMGGDALPPRVVGFEDIPPKSLGMPAGTEVGRGMHLGAVTTFLGVSAEVHIALLLHFPVVLPP